MDIFVLSLIVSMLVLKLKEFLGLLQSEDNK